MNGDRQNTMKMIKNFLAMEDSYDYTDFVHMNGSISMISDAKVAARFIKTYMSEEEYEEFCRRNFPFTSEDPVQKAKDDELKARVIDVANRVAKGEANLIDIILELNITFKHYMFYVNKIAEKGNEMSRHVVMKNRAYYWDKQAYNIIPNMFNVHFLHLSQKDEDKIREIVKKCSIPLNSINYMAAYRYAIRKNIIKLNKTK